MNEQILLWAKEFLGRVDLNAKEIPAFAAVMQAIEDELTPAPSEEYGFDQEPKSDD